MNSCNHFFSISRLAWAKKFGNLTLLVNPFSSPTANYFIVVPSDIDNLTTALSHSDVLKLYLLTWSCISHISTWPSILPKKTMLGLCFENMPVEYMTSVLGEMNIGIGLMWSTRWSPSLLSLKSNNHRTKFQSCTVIYKSKLKGDLWNE